MGKKVSTGTGTCRVTAEITDTNDVKVSMCSTSNHIALTMGREQFRQFLLISFDMLESVK